MSATINIKYIGTGVEDAETGHCTLNNIYRVIHLKDNMSAAIIDDNGDLHVISNAITHPLQWELASITVPGEVQIYP